jgi:hypothetical protein
MRKAKPFTAKEDAKQDAKMMRAEDKKVRKEIKAAKPKGKK